MSKNAAIIQRQILTVTPNLNLTKSKSNSVSMNLLIFGFFILYLHSSK